MNVSAEDQQTLLANHYVAYGSETQPPYRSLRLTGPLTLQTTAQIDHAHIGYNYLMLIGNHFQLEPALGVSYDNVRLESVGLTSPANRIAVTVHQYGLSIGITPRWSFNRYIAVEARIRAGIAINKDWNSSDTIVLNPAIVLSPTPHIAISLGAVRRDQELSHNQYVEAAHSYVDGSDIDMRFDGLSAGLRVIF